MRAPTEIANRVFARNPMEREFLREKHLIVVGAGSAGSALAMMAALAGLGRFTLIDLDTLEPENVCRHLGDLGYVGEPKVDAVTELIRRVNPAAEIRPLAEDFRSLDSTGLVIDPDTLLVGATDSFECQSLVNLLSLETRTPAVYVGCWAKR